MQQSVAHQGVRGAISLVLLAAASACSGPVINEAYMARDPGGDEKADAFYEIGDEIHAIVFANGGGPDTTMKFSLQGPMVSEFETYPWPNKKSLGEKVVDGQLYRRDATTGEKLIDGPWLLGNYRMHVELEGESADLDFAVIPLDTQ